MRHEDCMNLCVCVCVCVCVPYLSVFVYGCVCVCVTLLFMADGRRCVCAGLDSIRGKPSCRRTQSWPASPPPRAQR